MLWVLFCMVHLTVWSCNVTYVFQSESILLARRRCKIWILKLLELRVKPTTNHLAIVHKWTNTQLLQPNWPNDWAELWVLICRVHLTVCSYHVTTCLLWARSSFQVGRWVDSYRVWIHSEMLMWHDKNIQQLWQNLFVIPSRTWNYK